DHAVDGWNSRGPNLAKPAWLCRDRLRRLGHFLLPVSQDNMRLAAFAVGLGCSFSTAFALVGTSPGAGIDRGADDSLGNSCEYMAHRAGAQFIRVENLAAEFPRRCAGALSFHGRLDPRRRKRCGNLA